MASVWVIEQGEYSDYHVVGIFTSEAAARLVLERLDTEYSSYSHTIDEWPLDPAVEELNAGLTRWGLLMLRDGTVEQAPQPVGLTGYSIVNEIKLWERSKALAYQGKDTPDVLNAAVWARDSEHAIKIVNERRTQMIASDEWR